MKPQLDRIEQKLDALDAKMDEHLDRLARAETSIGWLKYGFSLLLSTAAMTGLALSKYL